MGPMSLSSCYVCGQSFSPQSITFHEPKCLIRWRSENNSLPPDKRCSTPIKMEDGDTYSNDSVWTCLRCYNIFPANKRGEHMATCALPKIERPKTRTLNRGNPNGLSLIHPSKHGAFRLLRPQTKTLQRPTPNMEHPVIDGIIRDINNSLQTDINDVEAQNEKNQEKTEPSAEDKSGKKSHGVAKAKGSQKENKKDEKPKSNVFPPPCRSCQRNDAPERFHSHHRTSNCCPAKKKTEGSHSAESDAGKSKMETGEKKLSPMDAETKAQTLHPLKKKSPDTLTPVKGPPPPAPPPVPSPRNDQDNRKKIKSKNNIVQEKVANTKSDEEARQSSGQAIKRPRIVLCYLCGREFGIRSYPFHEPHCIERWQRDNQALPQELRRSIPQRPTTGEGFSDTAWETFQAQLVPCPSCGRTFFPNRLPIHQKACKGPDKGAPGPVTNACTLPSVRHQDNQEDADKKVVHFRPALMTCYICGRNFGSMSLALHEPQCLKKLKQENEQLPAAQQRRQPQKPKAVFKEDGTLDSIAMEEAAWQGHLVQLAPCKKCGRTFFPDRLETHEPNCKAEPLQANSQQGSKVPKLAAVNL